jgi:deazaflavin-dependent oxidoreductase (nitroreductase family)
MTLATILLGVILVMAVVGLGFVVGMRTKSPLVLRPLIAFSRAVLNPRQMRQAGRPGAFASIIRHRGRRTGRAYETPVGVIPGDDEDALLIILPYGARTQWLRNVLAAGEATLVTEGRTIHVDRPTVVPTRDVAARFSTADRRSIRLLGTDDCLRLHRVAEAPAAVEAALVDAIPA